MTFEEVYKTLAAKRYFIFSPEDICAFFPSEKKMTVKQHLSRWKKSGRIISLRRGLYELVFPECHNISDFYLANRIYSPSYVSLETALSHYSMIPEVAMSVLSVTAKPTRRFKAGNGFFTYHSVQPKAFCGYRIEKHQGFDIFIAEPEKALVDFLYFKTPRSKDDLASLRLHRGRTARLNRKKLNVYGKIYGIQLKEILDAYL